MGKIFGFLSVGSFLALTGIGFFNYEIPFFLWILFFASAFAGFAWHVSKKSLFLWTASRVFEAFTALLLTATITFGLLHTLPGGPFDREKALPPAVKAHINAKYHLDDPIYSQYLRYMSGLLKGYLGESYKYTDRTVSDILKSTLPVSVQLGVYALLFAFLLGVPLGVASAQKAGSFWDRSAMFFSISGVSLPGFVTAPALVLFFASYLGWFEEALWEGPSFYVLPAVVLGLRPMGVIARLTRSGILDVSRSDYVRTARAKGLNETSIFYKHVLKNGFLPVLTFSGPLIAGVLTGSFVIEKIFAIPGIGLHFVNSVTNRDYPLILGGLLIYSFLLILSNLIVDLLYTYFDPRIKVA